MVGGGVDDFTSVSSEVVEGTLKLTPEDGSFVLRGHGRGGVGFGGRMMGGWFLVIFEGGR